MLETPLDLGLPYLPGSAVTDENRARIRDLARQAGEGGEYLLELYLTHPAPRADLSVGFTNHPHDTDHLRRLSERCWPGLDRFAREWNTPTSLVGHSIHAVGLEFDCGSPARAASTPSVFLGFCHRREEDQRCLEVTVDRHFRAAEQAIALLEQRLESSARENLLRCFHRFVPRTRVIGLGVWLSRGGAPFRFVPMGFPTERVDEMFETLRSVGWAGSRDDHVRAWHRLPYAGMTLSPGIDVGASVSPGLKLEMACVHRLQQVRRQRWSRLMDVAAREYGAFLDRCRTVLAWPGGNKLDRFPGSHGRILARAINHVKLSLDADGRTEIKAYLRGTLWPRQPVTLGAVRSPRNRRRKRCHSNRQRSSWPRRRAIQSS